MENYKVELLESDSYKIFKGVYNDFRAKAVEEYKFELEPLEFDEFIDAIEKKYMQCIVLKENTLTKARLDYTTPISEAIVLFMTHCLVTLYEGNKNTKMLRQFQNAL